MGGGGGGGVKEKENKAGTRKMQLIPIQMEIFSSLSKILLLP